MGVSTFSVLGVSRQYWMEQLCPHVFKVQSFSIYQKSNDLARFRVSVGRFGTGSKAFETHHTVKDGSAP